MKRMGSKRRKEGVQRIREEGEKKDKDCKQYQSNEEKTDVKWIKLAIVYFKSI